MINCILNKSEEKYKEQIELIVSGLGIPDDEQVLITDSYTLIEPSLLKYAIYDEENKINIVITDANVDTLFNIMCLVKWIYLEAKSNGVNPKKVLDLLNLIVIKRNKDNHWEALFLDEQSKEILTHI